MNADWPYAAIMLAAIALGVLVSRCTQSRLPLERGQRIAIFIGAFVGGMVGAKLPFLLSDWDGLVSGRGWFESGKTILFGLVGGYFGVEVAKWSTGVTVKTGDSFAVPVAVAVGVGRLACFVGGCCYGTPTHLPWGVDFGDGVCRHPTQLYECAFHLSAACVLALLRRGGYFPGQLVKLYILAYLAYRFLTEFIRPEPVLAAGLTGYQIAALGLAPIFVWLWWRDARAQKAVIFTPETVT